MFGRKKKESEKIDVNSETKKEESSVEITMSQEDAFLKLDISDYIKGSEYVERMKVIDSDEKIQISNNILWNSSKQCIDKGTYYVISVDNRIYNIKINEHHIEIDEITKHSDGYSSERILNIHNDSKYYYSSFKHDTSGSTYETLYYNNVGEVWIPRFHLSKGDVFCELWELLTRLQEIQNIDKIIDTDLLRKMIVDDLVEEYYYVYNVHEESGWYEFAKYNPKFNVFYDKKHTTDGYYVDEKYGVLELGQKVYIDNFFNVYPFEPDPEKAEIIKQIEAKYAEWERKHPDLWPEEEETPNTKLIVDEYIKERIDSSVYTDPYVTGIVHLLYKPMGIKVRRRHGGSLYLQIGFDYPEQVYESLDALYNLLTDVLSNLKDKEVLELVLYSNGSYGLEYDKLIKELNRRTGYTFTSDLEERINSNFYHSNYGRMKKLGDLVPVVYISKDMCIYDPDRDDPNSLKEEITPGSCKEKYFGNNTQGFTKKLNK